MDDKLVLKKSFERSKSRTQTLSNSACRNGGCLPVIPLVHIETGQFNPTAKLALILCVLPLDKSLRIYFYFSI